MTLVEKKLLFTVLLFVASIVGLAITLPPYLSQLWHEAIQPAIVETVKEIEADAR